MRRGKAEWLVYDDVLTGIIINADWCAEHEWGISGIEQAFGIVGNPEVMGVERRRISRVPPLLRGYTFTEKLHALILWKYLPASEVMPSDLHLPSEATLAGAWDRESFGIMTSGSGVQNLAKLCEAINSNDLAVFTSGSSKPFGGGGLVFAIISAMTSEHLHVMEEADREADRLQKASDATGIIERLAAAGCKYYACSPRFSWEGDRESGYPVRYFLNPQDQKKHQSGWYTVEELDQWAKGTGPVLEMRK